MSTRPSFRPRRGAMEPQSARPRLALMSKTEAFLATSVAILLQILVEFAAIEVRAAQLVN